MPKILKALEMEGICLKLMGKWEKNKVVLLTMHHISGSRKGIIFH